MKRLVSLCSLALLAPTTRADEIIVAQFLQTFSPQDVTIDEGDTVTWMWTSGVHTTTEGTDTSIDPTDAWHSPLTTDLQSFSVTFDAAFLAANPRPGNRYDYLCIPHFANGMVGSVTVDTGGDGPTIYCTAKTSSAGCVTQMDMSDPSTQPVSGAADYAALAASVQGGKAGIMFFGINGQAALPFNNGTLCVSPPLGRAPIQFSGGTTPTSCDGSFSQTINDGGATSPNLDRGPGTQNWMQWWYRDPDNGAGNLGTALSDAAEVTYQ